MQNSNFSESSKLTLKGLLIGILILALLIPTLFISSIITDRKKYQQQAEQHIAKSWAKEQYIVGPMLVIPYINENNNKDYYYVFPENLDINSNIAAETRNVGIFKSVVYQSKIKMKGVFLNSDLSKSNIPFSKLLINEVKVCFVISDYTRGLSSLPKFNWVDTELTLNAESVINSKLQTNLNAPISINTTSEQYNFEFDMDLRGSSGIYFAPVGKNNTAQITSNWQHPSFIDNYSPSKSTVNKNDGFNVEWKILNLNRNLTDWIEGCELNENKTNFLGVTLYQTSSIYSKTDKAIKYAILLIALTFVVCFFIELIRKYKVHPLQYILVGLALCLFYVLLLSISEYLNFNYAYLLASFATISLIALYVKSVFNQWKIAGIFAAVLGLLYTFVFVLIQLHETALLVGSLGLFLLLATIMYYSRRISWYNKQNDDKPSEV